jgi:AcrR family transcriptional regulator
MEAKMSQRGGRLGREAWVAAAFRLLGRRGIAAVGVEPLAKALGVTKGSFYWHFKDRRALLEALLAYWEERETSAIIADVEAVPGPPADQLRRLYLRARADRDALGPELAIRDWARHDRFARKAVVAVDARRMAYIARLFRPLSAGAAEAEAKAELAYGLVVAGWMIFSADRDRGARLRRAYEMLLKDENS